MQDLSLVWSAPFLDRSGYGAEARDFVLGLHDLGIDVGADPFAWIPWTARLASGDAEMIERLLTIDPPERFVHVVHGRPYDLARHPAAEVAIGRTLFETMGPLPTEAIAEMDEIWVASDFNLRSFAAAGIDERTMFKVPQAVSLSLYDADPPPLVLPVSGDSFVFLSVFVWQLRKGCASFG